jgi:L-ribulose-5-phosphate 3-epimerase
MAGFRLAVFTDEISQDLEKALGVVQEYALDGVEIRSVWDRPPQALDKKDIAEAKRLIDRAGLRVCSIGSPFFKCDIDSPEECREHLEILERCIGLADALGAPIIRGFTFWRKGDLESHWQRILDHFPEPVRKLERAGLILGIENEHSTFIGTGEKLARFLAEIDSPHVRAVWDPANSVHDIDDDEIPYPDGYEAIKQWVDHVHIKDADKDENGKPFPVCLGDGVIDMKGQLRALEEDGYRGYVSLETHWRPKALSEEELNRPGGATFSQEGEYATRRCLEWLHATLTEMGGSTLA